MAFFEHYPSVPKAKLIEVRGANETKYYVEVVGTIISDSRMRPVVINAIDLTILGDCPNQISRKEANIKKQ